MGMQSGFTKYCCFLCLWDSRATTEHYIKKEWGDRQHYTPGMQSVSAKPLVDRSHILLPPLHIKLGLIKNFVKAQKPNEPGFQYLVNIFPKISYAKIKEGIFVGPDIRKLMKDNNFDSCLSADEFAAWSSFKSLVKNFLGKNKSSNYRQIVEELLQNYSKINARMSLKIHFLHSHLDFFPGNLGDTSDEQGERLHQDLQRIEKNYKGYWDEGMLSDYCWSIMRETDSTTYNRQSLTASHF